MIPDPLPWCELIDLRLEAAVSPGRPLRWGPLPEDERDDSRLDFGRVFGPWDVPPGDPTDSLWLDISQAMTQVQWTGGSAAGDTVFSRWEAAQLQAQFHDPDLLLDPTNYLSPFQKRTVPNTPVRIRGGFRIPPGVETRTDQGRLYCPGVLALPPDTGVVQMVWGGVIDTDQPTGIAGGVRLTSGPIELRMGDTGRLVALVVTNGGNRSVVATDQVTRGQGTQKRVTWDQATGTLTLEAQMDWPHGPWHVDAQESWPGELLDPAQSLNYGSTTTPARAANARHCGYSWTVDGVEVFSWDRLNITEAGEGATTFVSDQGDLVTATGDPGPVLDPLPGPAATFAILFGGFADSWTPVWAANPINRYTTLIATDGVRILSGFDPVAGSPTGNGETASARIHRILNHADWPDDQRDITPGGWSMNATDHAQPAWTELLLTADSDLGMVWLAPDGRLAYRPGDVVRSELSKPPVAAFGCEGWDIITAASVEFDAQTLRNLVTGSNGEGTPVTRADEGSAARYRYRTYKRTDLVMNARADLVTWVELVTQLGSAPRRYIRQMAMEPTLVPASFRWLLIPNPLESWAISWEPPGDSTGHVVREVVTPGGWVHQVTPDRWETVISSGILPPIPFLKGG